MDYSFQIMTLPHKRMYLKNTREEVAIRSLPGSVTRFYAKQRGGEEYEINHLSMLLHKTLKSAKRITKGEYVQY